MIKLAPFALSLEQETEVRLVDCPAFLADWIDEVNVNSGFERIICRTEDGRPDGEDWRLLSDNGKVAVWERPWLQEKAQ